MALLRAIGSLGLRPLVALLLLIVLPVTGANGQGSTPRVVILGSSTAAGSNASPLSLSWAGQYTAWLASTFPGSTVTNLAVGGFTTFSIMPTGNVPPSPWNTPAYQPATGNNITAALALNPTLIIINLPTNDADDHVPVDQQLANYSAIVGAAAAQGVPVWIATPQPRTTLDDIGHQLQKEMIGATYEAFPERTVDFWTGLGDAIGAILPAYNSDGLHLNNAGHAILYDRIITTVTTAAPPIPSIAIHPRGRSVVENDSTSFLSIALAAPNLAYQWQRNGVDIPGATSPRYAIAHAPGADSGAIFRCIVSSGIGRDTSNGARLSVQRLPATTGGVVSDDFSGASIRSALWTIVNPLNDAVFSLNGTGTSDARLSIAVPGGTNHDLWTGAFNAPRILQTVANTDLSVEAKFDGTLSAEYQTEGIVAVQDASTLIRFDFVRDATRTRFFAASFSGGTPTVRKDTVITAGAPLYMRVQRTGNTWTGQFSTNGSTWITAVSFSTAFTLTAIGPFAGNAGAPAPAHTALVDYFFTTTAPIVPEDGTVVTPVPPTITSQPLSRTVSAGQPVTFSVTASGTGTLSYQWQRNTVPINGANGPDYTINPATRADSGASFRCVVSNGAGPATSNDAVLTVLPVVTPVTFVSDDFSGASINTSLWSVVNPLGDATFSLTGTGSADARLAISVPAATSHDLWLGAFNAPRILQTIPNTDFSIDVRFESAFTTGYQIEGIVVQQDASTMLRFDIVRDPSVTRFFAASFVGGVATVRKDTTIAAGGALIMRVTRQGSTWTGSYSLNGTTWVTAVTYTQALTVTAAGPFAGNHGIPVSSAPAFTALIDYAFNTVSPIVPEDGPSLPVAPTLTTEPSGVTVTAGQPATFTVTATGTAPLVFAWQRNGQTISGATSASYTIAATAKADSGATFRCIVTNGVGADTSVTVTLRVTSPPAGVTSDNFNAAALNGGLWQFVNPLGDVTLSMTGTQVRLVVPAGTNHDLWTGAFNAPRLMQTVPNTDLSVEAKFDDAMNGQYQNEGIVAVQDGSTMIRFDFVRDASNTRFFAASFSGGTPTIRKDTVIASGAPWYLRVQRSGDTWTAFISTNGTTWRNAVSFSAPVTLTAIGPFAGNAGSPAPAHTALIDYFFTTAAPLSPSVQSAARSVAQGLSAEPTAWQLFQNYPNPFNPSTRITYALPAPAHVEIRVYNTLGAEVAVLVNGERTEGIHEAVFDAAGLPSGVYFCRMIAGSFSANRKLMLVR